jgi:acyl-CoA synthetase (AMP-forming)/AMP-acid ligase II
MADHVDAFATSKPDEPALVDGERVVTWAGFAARRELIGRALRDAGVAPGDAVAVYEVNSAEYFILLSAIQLIGATSIQVNWRLTAEEVLYVLDNSDAVAAFVNEAFVPTVGEIVEKSGVRVWITIGESRPTWGRDLEGFVDGARDAPPLDRAQGPGETMIYTGGTTGKPKGVRRGAMTPDTVDPRVFEAMGAFLHTMRLDLPHTHLVTAALYHAGPVGYASLALTNGGTAVIMRKFEAEEAYRLIERHRVTSTFMPPVVAKRMLDLPEEVRGRYDASSLEVFVVTAGPVPQQLKEAILDTFGPVYYEAYSSTETALCATALTPADVRDRPGSCGRVVAGEAFSIRDEKGVELPRGELGLVCAPNHRGVFSGYHKDPELSSEVFIDEWLTVGDIGYMDDDGFLYIVDRVRDMIISGGVNIYSAEIENVLHGHPAIQDVAVFGVPDEEWGERVHVAVQLKAGASFTLEEMQAFSRRNLAGYKVPRELSIHTDFPRDAAGKLAKRVLREQFIPQPQ